MRYKFLNITILFFAFTALTYSQNAKNIENTQVNELEEMVITATRTSRQLSSLPLPVTLISKEKIQKSGSLRLNEILREQTGIVITNDRSGFEGIQMQGIDSEYIMILLDGVPMVGRKSGNLNLERIAVGNIKQIEVIKGPSSCLYGSEALGGVINIITEKPDTQEFSGNATYTGSYRRDAFIQQDMNLELSQKLDKFSYSFFANRFSSDGYDLVLDDDDQTIEPFDNYTLNGRFYYNFNNKLSLFSSTRYYSQEQEATQIDRANTKKYLGEAIENDLNVHLKLDHQWHDKLNLIYEFYYTNYQNDRNLDEENDTQDLISSFFNQKIIRPELRGTYTLKKDNEITTGIGYQYDELDRTYSDQKVNFESQYVYGQFDASPFERLNVIVGARFDNHSEYNNQLSPKLSARFKITEAIAVKGSVGYGFKAPDFRQLYLNFTNPTAGYTVFGHNVALDGYRELIDTGTINPTDAQIAETEKNLGSPLKAESSIGYNLGATFSEGKFKAEVNFFRNDFQNLIDTYVLATKTSGQNVFSYRNINESFNQGIEFNSSVKLANILTISGGYQLLYFYDKDVIQEIEDGKKFARDTNNETVKLTVKDYFGLPNRSKHQANIKVFYDILKYKSNINLRILYRSKYGFYDTNSNSIIDSYDRDESYIKAYVTANISAGKTLFEGVDFQIGANNAFNYRDARIPLPGIQAYARLNYQF